MKKSSVITSSYRERYKIFLLYTLLFCVFVVGIFAVLILSHRSVMQFHDAYKQGAFRLVEFRNQLSNILSGAGFSFWSWYEGPGLDEPLENFMDPCSLIGSLFPIRYLELGFTFAALLRMYLGGLAFIVLGREVELEDRKVLLGAVLYTFSACFIGLAVRQSESLINAYLFPILVASVDRIYKGKNPLLFILTVAYYMLLAIYYAYMSAIAIVMYILIRYFAYSDEFRFDDYILTIGKFISYGIVGIMISACSSVFSAFTIMRASTDSTGGTYGLLFDSDWYTTFGKMLLGTGATFDYSDIGPYVLILMLMPVAVRYISKRSTATIMMIILFAMMLIPFFCSMFNGFGYITPRWSYTLLLFMEWCGIEQFEAERFKDRKNLMLAGLGLVVIAIWTFGFYSLGIIQISRTGRIYVPLQLAAGALLLMLLAVIGRQGRISRRIYAAFFLIPLISLSLGWARGFSNNIENFARNSSVYNNLQESALRAGPEIEDEGFYRIDSVDAISRHAVIKFPSNENIWWKTNNLIIYNSRIPKTLTDFNVELGNSYGYARRVFMVSNGNRMGLDFLYGVRYFLGSDAKDPEGTKDSDNYAAYGFGKTGEIDGVNVFRNKYDAGLGFVLPEAMSQSEFEKLGRLEMEQAMLQAAVIPDDQTDKAGDAPMINAEDLDIEIEDIPFEVTSTDGCTVENGSIIADKGDASFTISVKDVPESQLVVSFDNLLLNSKDGIDGGSYEIYAEDGRVLKHVVRQKSRQGVAGLKNHDINMGHLKGDDDIRITLTSKGTYTFDRLYVSAMSLANYDRYASKCTDSRFRVRDYSDRKVEGTVSSDEGGILFLSIPAHDNWDVYVDGVKADKISGLDTAFCGVYVEKGKHLIMLRYNNPYVKYGSIVSVLGLLILAVIQIKRHRDRKNEK